MDKREFKKILDMVSKQSGEEKLMISFKLSKFVRDLRAQGELYAKKKSVSRTK